jgi:hypothetical protein
MLAFDDIKRVWEPLLGFAAWMAAGIGAFLTFPIELSSTSTMGSTIAGAAQAFVAAGYGVVLLTVRSRSKAARRIWLRAAIAAVALLVGSFFLYVLLQESWTCPYALGVKLVIGEYPTDKLVSYLREAGDRATCIAVLDFAGATTEMFHRTNLIVRFVLLAVTYMVAWISLAGVVVFIGAGLSAMPHSRRKAA